jgi:hypothetical protein
MQVPAAASGLQCSFSCHNQTPNNDIGISLVWLLLLLLPPATATAEAGTPHSEQQQQQQQHACLTHWLRKLWLHADPVPTGL